MNERAQNYNARIALMRSISKMAWLNLRRNLRRNLATGIAITAGFTAFLLAAGYANRVNNVLSRYTIFGLRAGHITILKKDALEMYAIRPRTWSLSLEEQTKISRALSSISDVEMSGKMLIGQGIIGNGCKTFPFIALGVEMPAEKYAMTNPELLKWAPHVDSAKIGKPIWEFNENESNVALSAGLARLLGKSKVKDQFQGKPNLAILNCNDEKVREHFSDDANVQLASGTWDGQLNALDADMVQTYSTGMIETNNSSVTIPLKYLQNLFNTENVRSYSIWLKDPSQLEALLARIKTELNGIGGEYDVLPWNDERIGPYYVGTMRFIFTMVAFIGCVLALVIVLSIFNSATMTVIERSEEVGMLRSLGYNRRLIRILFALEGFYLTIVSTLAGIICSMIAIAIINNLHIKFNPPGVEGGIDLKIAQNIGVMLIASICVGSLGVLSTWLAVAGISRKNIALLVAGTYR